MFIKVDKYESGIPETADNEIIDYENVQSYICWGKRKMDDS